VIKDRRLAVYPYLSEDERIVLSVLDGQALRGLDIVRNSGGLLRRGSIYLLLDRMEEHGQGYFAATMEDTLPLVFTWLEPTDEVDPRVGIQRRIYQGTSAGYYWLSRYWQEKRLHA
jgi:DNA-binding PadR family transcriptional regulator